MEFEISRNEKSTLPTEVKIDEIVGALSFQGEGLFGEFDPFSSEDIKLLRLDIFVAPLFEGQFPTSVCTQITEGETEEFKKAFLNKLITEINDILISKKPLSIKKLIENACFQPDLYVAG